jgi:hypothetical protein
VIACADTMMARSQLTIRSAKESIASGELAEGIEAFTRKRSPRRSPGTQAEISVPRSSTRSPTAAETRAAIV